MVIGLTFLWEKVLELSFSSREHHGLWLLDLVVNEDVTSKDVLAIIVQNKFGKMAPRRVSKLYFKRENSAFMPFYLILIWIAFIVQNSSFCLLQCNLANWPFSQAVIWNFVLELNGFSWRIGWLCEGLENLVWVLAILVLVLSIACRFFFLSFLFQLFLGLGLFIRSNEVLESIDGGDVDWRIIFFDELSKIFNFLGGRLVLNKSSPCTNLFMLDNLNWFVFFNLSNWLFSLLLLWFSNLDQWMRLWLQFIFTSFAQVVIFSNRALVSNSNDGLDRAASANDLAMDDVARLVWHSLAEVFI